MVIVFHTHDPGGLVAEYVGDCMARSSDVVYVTRYLGKFELRDWLSTQWREYDNPPKSAATVEATALSSDSAKPNRRPASTVPMAVGTR